MSRRWSISAGAIGASIVLAGVPAAALAGPMGTPGAPGGVIDNPAAVPANDSTSLALRIYATPNVSMFLNAQGDVSVTRGAAFTPIGSSPAGYGGYIVEAQWDELVSPTTNTLKVVWRTSTGQKFLPPNPSIQGQSAIALEWRIGVTDPVSWVPNVSHCNLVAAFIKTSTTGGGSLISYNITQSVSNPWNGTSFGTTLPISAFTNVNYIEANFVYTPVVVPAPWSGAGLLLAIGVCAGRRRRVAASCRGERSEEVWRLGRQAA